MNTLPPLTNPRQEKFCIEYFRMLGIGKPNATQAALLAGYSLKTAGGVGNVNLHRPYMAKRIEELKRAAAKGVVADAQERMEKLTELVRHEPLPENISGRDRVLAVSELNKMDGSYAPERKHIDVSVDVSFQIGKGYQDRLAIEDAQPDTEE